MDFHARIAGLSNALKRIEKRQKIKALRERLKNGDYGSAREAHLIKKQIKRLMTRTASNAIPDVDMARDISLTLCNDSKFHPTLLRMLSGVATHMAKGRYNKGGALTQCVNIVNAYLPTYKKDNRMPYLRVNKATKELAAQEILEDQMEIIEEMAEKLKKPSNR